MVAAPVEADLRWRQAGPPYLLTRDELVEELARRGYATSERQIVSWVSYGILPKSERKVPKLAGDRLPRALYPAYLIPALQELLHHAGQNATIAQLREMAPAILATWRERLGGGPPGVALSGTASGKASGSATLATSAALSGTATGTAGDSATLTMTDPRVRPPLTRLNGARATAPPAIPRALQRALWAYAQHLAELRQSAPVEARLVVQLAEGDEEAIAVPAPPPPRAKQRRGRRSEKRS